MSVGLKYHNDERKKAEKKKKELFTLFWDTIAPLSFGQRLTVCLKIMRYKGKTDTSTVSATTSTMEAQHG